MQNLTQKNSIYNFAKKYYQNIDHAEHVKELSLMLFDKTQGILHDYSGKERDNLIAGALLHDIGHHLSNKNHNINSYKMIMNHEFDGFEKKDIEIIANITRYHRGRMPDKQEDTFTSISKESRKEIKKLAGMVKLADALDDQHNNLIKKISLEYDKVFQVLSITLNTLSENFKPDLSVLLKKKDLFEKAFNVQLVFKFNVTSEL